MIFYDMIVFITDLFSIKRPQKRPVKAELKILVSPVRSRPTPLVHHSFSEGGRKLKTSTEMLGSFDFNIDNQEANRTSY